MIRKFGVTYLTNARIRNNKTNNNNNNNNNHNNSKIYATGPLAL
jgi:hypothetical protein